MFSLARRIVVAGLFALVALPVSAQQVQLLSTADAHAKQQAGEIALIDVRQPEEWTESGVAEGADLIALRDPELSKKLEALTGGDKDAPVALICRTGARSGYLAKLMANAGYTNVYSVDGGMMGKPGAVGWIKDGLPVSKTRRSASGDVEVCETC